MIHDLLGERAEAKKSYRMALAVETDGIAKDAARQYLNEPYRKEATPRPVADVDDAKGIPKTP